MKIYKITVKKVKKIKLMIRLKKQFNKNKTLYNKHKHLKMKSKIYQILIKIQNLFKKYK